MTDLTQPYHSHGSTGEKPPNGLDKAGGDQYEAEYFDYFADQDNKQTQEKNDAITRRVTHLSGDRILDGLDVTEGSGSRDVDISSSTGAYVNGQFTSTIDSRSITLSSNGSGSERTDSVYVDANGNVSTKEGTTTVPSSTYKIAEVDLSTNDTITAIRDVGLQRTKHGVAPDRPSGTIGNTLYHEGGSPTGREGKGTYEVHDGNEWRELLFADGRQTRTDHQWYGGNNIYNVGNIYNDDGSGPSFEDKFVNTNLPNSTEVMDGPLATPRFKNATSPERMEVFRENNYFSNNAEAHVFRYTDDDGSGSREGGFVFEGANQDGSGRRDLLTVREPWQGRNFHYDGKPVATQPWTEDTQLSSREYDAAEGTIAFNDGMRVNNHSDQSAYDNGIKMWWDTSQGNGGSTSRLSFRQGDGHPSFAIWNQNGSLRAENGSDHRYFRWDLKPEDGNFIIHDDFTVEGVNKTTGTHVVENNAPRTVYNDTSINADHGRWSISTNAGDLRIDTADGFGIVIDHGGQQAYLKDGNGNTSHIASV